MSQNRKSRISLVFSKRSNIRLFMNYHFVFGPLIAVAALCFTTISCSKSGDPCANEKTILPGECLNSSELSFTELRINDFTGPKSFVFNCSFDMEDDINPAGPPFASYDYKRVPSNEVYERFGANAKAVKESYDQYWNDCFVSGNMPELMFATTIVYESGMKLIADKDFAGFKAGENIVATAKESHKGEDGSAFLEGLYSSDALDLPNEGGYYLSSSGVIIKIPLKDYTVVEEDVTFHLSVPVKVGLLLTWFNDRIVNPNAPYSYREDILSCSFTVHKGLH